MNFYNYTGTLACIILPFAVFTQHLTGPSGPGGEIFHSARKSELRTCPLGGETGNIALMEPSGLDLQVAPIAVLHASASDVAIMKAEKTLAKAEDAPVQGGQAGSRASTPIVGTNFLGNEQGFSTPPDNTMAISNGGRIVAADNETIEYYNENGAYLSTNVWHYDFFNNPSLNGNIFDPRLLYDSGSDRFIFVILHGSNSTNTDVIVSFSKTNNPANGWWTYYMPGNPLNNGTWTDYPNIAVTDNELIITGNLFTNSGYFDQSYVFQIDKSDGYSGSSLDYVVWDNILDASGDNAFTIVPASHGQQGNYGPGCYMVSSNSYAGSSIFLYHLTGEIGANPQLNAYEISVPSYSVAGNAYQSGTSNVLSTGDCRMHHAFYLNGIVHAVHSTAEGFNGTYSQINYYRIPVADLSYTDYAHYNESGFDIAYPCLASYGLEPEDQGVMIGFLRSGSSIYPEVGVVHCDNFMDFSSRKLVKSGETYVNILSNSEERWGDYSTMQRKHNASPPEVWMSGAFGDNNSWDTRTWSAWIAEIKGTYEPAPAPVAAFSSDTVEGYSPLTIHFTDESLNNPTSWTWAFPGSLTPAINNLQNPSVTYVDTGYFDVALTVSNVFGTDSTATIAYVHVLSSDTATPVDSTEITDTVHGMGHIPSLGNSLLYPNPAKDYVQYDFEVPERKEVTIDLLDINGRVVRSLFHDWPKPGTQRLRFNKLALNAGVYMVRIVYDGKIVKHEKLVVH